MTSIRTLSELAELATSGIPSDEGVERALPLLKRGLEASSVFLIYGAEDGFRCFGSCPEKGLNDVALWLVHRDLTSRGGPCAFDLDDGRVEGFRGVGSRSAADCVAALIPLANASAEMLVAYGPWAKGLGPGGARFLQASLPAAALLLERRLDSARAERQQHQVSALANITRVMSESEDMETVLTSITGTIAAVTGTDYVSIDLVNRDGTVELRCTNVTRPGIEQLQGRWQQGAVRPDPVRDAVLSTRRPMLFADVQNDERVPESGRNFFMRVLVRSAGTFPLLAKDEAIGTLSVASHQPMDFGPAELELLEGLAAQVASAVTGIRLYQELAESRKKLQHLNQQLQESMGIEHHLARTDLLTGIPNRRFIDETIGAEYVRARRYRQPLSVLLADVDDLKSINDTYGHEVGDEALKFLASLARQSCRQIDVVGRYGGDEFVFVLPATRGPDAFAFAERFRERLTETFVPVRSEDAVSLTVSLGVAEWNPEGMDGPMALIREADQALYAAKAGGRNRTVVADGVPVRAA